MDFAFNAGVTKYTKLTNNPNWNLNILKDHASSTYINGLFFGYEYWGGYNKMKKIYKFRSFNVGYSVFPVNFGKPYQDANKQFKMGQTF